MGSLRGWLQKVVGDVAHDAADDGYPIKVGGKASTSEPSAVSNGDRVNAYFDANGRLHVVLDSITAGDINIGNVDVASIAAGDNNIGNVDIASALPTGANAIGKLAANSGVDIGDVDVTSLPTQGDGLAVTVTRPANTTAYTANDCLGAAAAAIQFANVVAGAGEYFITSASLEIDVTAVPSGMGNFKLHLYNVTPPSALADNAAHDIPAGDRASYLGYIDLGTPVDLGSTLYVQQEGLNKQITTASTSLFAYLTTDGGFTPAGNSEVYVVTIHTVRV